MRKGKVRGRSGDFFWFGDEYKLFYFYIKKYGRIESFYLWERLVYIVVKLFGYWV